MATATKNRNGAKGAKTARLRLPGAATAAKGKGKGKGKDGPQLVGAAGKRAKPNKLLLGGLAVVAVAGLGRVAMPSLFGGGSTHAVASFPAPLTNRHLVRHAPTAAPGATTATTAAGRPIRDPFTPPPGFGP